MPKLLPTLKASLIHPLLIERVDHVMKCALQSVLSCNHGQTRPVIYLLPGVPIIRYHHMY